MDADKVIIEPVVTEKTNALREGKTKRYVFRVDQRANKVEVMNAVRELFQVKPLSCHIMNVKPKPRSSRSRSGFHAGHTETWKKAIVTLRGADKIDIFEGG